jgi:hypothetical protein
MTAQAGNGMLARDCKTSGARASRLEKEIRLTQVEEMMLAGIASARIDRELQTKHGLSARQSRRYMAEVRERWTSGKREDLLHRREKLLRMQERVFARAMADKRYSAANGAIANMHKLSGGFAQTNEISDRVTQMLGPPPIDDPTGALIYAQKCLLLSLEDVMRDPSIDPERKVRLIADLSAKVGMTHPRTLIQHDLKRLKRRLLPAADPKAGLEPIDAIPAPRTSRGARRD